MSDADKVTLGEVYRLLKAQGDDIKEIKADVKTQNGRVGKLEQDSIRLKAYWTSGVVAAGFFGDYIKHKVFGG